MDLEVKTSEQFVSFSAEINSSTSESLIALIAHLANRGASKVHLLLSTPGGSVMHGLHVYNVLRALPIFLITHNVGNVDSIGNVVFLAGAERRACANATFMFHGVGFEMTAGTKLVDRCLKEQLDSIQSDQKRIGSVVGSHTKLTEQDLAGLFKEAKTKEPGWAKEVGLINSICNPEMPSGAQLHGFVFNR